MILMFCPGWLNYDLDSDKYSGSKGFGNEYGGVWYF